VARKTSTSARNDVETHRCVHFGRKVRERERGVREGEGGRGREGKGSAFRLLAKASFASAVDRPFRSILYVR